MMGAYLSVANRRGNEYGEDRGAYLNSSPVPNVKWRYESYNTFT